MLLPSGQVLVAAGANSSAILASAELYDASPTPRPTISAAPVTVECTSPSGTNATLVMHVNAANGDALTVSWDQDGQTAAVPAGTPNPTDADAQLTASFPKGTTNVMATATDSANATASVATSVTVQDPCPQSSRLMHQSHDCGVSHQLHRSGRERSGRMRWLALRLRRGEPERARQLDGHLFNE